MLGAVVFEWILSKVGFLDLIIIGSYIFLVRRVGRLRIVRVAPAVRRKRFDEGPKTTHLEHNNGER